MTSTTSATPVHFLLVEDDMAHADLVQLSFQDNPVANTIEHVTSGIEALVYLNREGEYADRPMPDVILLDLKLPGLGGHDVLERIKGNPDLRHIPIVVLTTSANDSDRRLAYERNANSFLTKPLNFDKFQQMIRDLQLYWSVWNQPPAPRN